MERGGSGGREGNGEEVMAEESKRLRMKKEEVWRTGEWGQGVHKRRRISRERRKGGKCSVVG